MGCGASSSKRPVMVEAAAAKSPTSKSKAATATAQPGKELDEQNRSAIKMQAHFRGKQTRRLADQRRDQFAMERELKMSSTAMLKRTASNRLERVNDYAFVKMLGKGAYGQVYLAEYDPAPEGTWAETTAETLSSFMGLSEKPPQVAIKCLSRSILKRKRVGRNGSAYDSVLGEIAIMKHLRHPNIVRLFEVIDDPDQDLLFMCMELVTGGDLFVSITQKRVVPEPELRGWVRGLVLGLEHLHLSGVCHRDIKPENFLWEPSTKQAKLADFGISGFFRATSLGGDFFNATSGSLMFFAPEMCRSLKGAGYSGRAADLWAMGVSIFMWIYWETPYTASNPPDLLKSIAEDPVVFPPKTPTPSTELLALVRGLLEKSPQQRSQIKHLRRDAFLTRGGADPLDTALPAHNARDGNVAVPKSELMSAIQRIRALNKSSLLCGTDEEVDYSLDYELVARNSTVSKGALDDAEQERMASMVLTKEETKEKSFERTTVESREFLATGEVAKGEAAAGPTPA